ncbi:hypothetical protein GJ825_22560, partial [Salmonella enterica]|nr:hypothetical protein [Salmonella enterica]
LDVSKKARNKKKAKKSKAALTPAEKKAKQADLAAKQERQREIKRTINAHSNALFQQYISFRNSGLDSPSATSKAFAVYEKAHGNKFNNQIWKQIKNKAGIRIYDRERQESRKGLNLTKIHTSLEVKRMALTANQKQVNNTNLSQKLHLVGGRKLPVTSMGLVICPVCKIYVKEDAVEHHLKHNHIGHIDNPLTAPVQVPVAKLAEEEAPVIKTPVVVVPVQQEKEERYFNKEVYQTALRTTTQGEAWKLATNEEACLALLSASVDAQPTVLPYKPENSVEADTVTINDIVATGRTVEVTHKTRHAGDQADFKKRVWDNFNRCCAVTGCPLPEGILEAAHIEAVTVEGNNNTSNGLLLEVTLHRLYDKGLMGINPDGLTVHFAVDCIHKTMFDGKALQPHHLALDADKLAEKWKYYKGDK